jgi:hypothetical protein
MSEHAVRERDVALLGEVVHGDAFDLDADPRPLPHEGCVRFEQTDERGTDVSTAEDAHSHATSSALHAVSLADRQPARNRIPCELA